MSRVTLVTAVASIVGCADPTGRPPVLAGLAPDDEQIMEIDGESELRSAIVELPEVGEAEILYANVDGRAFWTGDIFLGDADDLEAGFRGASLTSSLWPNRTVKYRFDPGIGAAAKSLLERGITKWESATSIRFVEVDAQETGGFAVFKSSDSGCWSSMGYPGAGSTNELNIGAGCEVADRVGLHELGHLIGLFHEQARADRDQHLEIDWTNIEAGEASQFDKYNKNGGSGSDRGVYDYDSIMHYGSDAFAVDKSKPVMQRKGGGLIGWSEALSAGDIGAVEAMYANEAQPDQGDDPADDDQGGGQVTPGSCQGQCGSSEAVDDGNGSTCYCDAGCVEYGDCCADRATECGGGADDGPQDDGGQAPSCSGHCDSPNGMKDANGQECYCDAACTSNGDCCGDYGQTCGGNGNGDDNGNGNQQGSCVGYCGGLGSAGNACYCDESCTSSGDCCADYQAACPNDGGGIGGGGDPFGSGSCAGQCGNAADQGGCFCDATCAQYGDCCGDYSQHCG